jgi:hypothetical protein
MACGLGKISHSIFGTAIDGCASRMAERAGGNADSPHNRRGADQRTVFGGGDIATDSGSRFASRGSLAANRAGGLGMWSAWIRSVVADSLAANSGVFSGRLGNQARNSHSSDRSAGAG